MDELSANAEPDNKLLERLIIKIATSGRGEGLEGIRQVLDDYGLDSSIQDFDKSPLNSALQQLNNAYSDAATRTEDVAAIVAGQKKLAGVVTNTLDKMRYEMLKSRTRMNYCASQLSSALDKAIAKEDSYFDI